MNIVYTETSVFGVERPEGTDSFPAKYNLCENYREWLNARRQIRERRLKPEYFIKSLYLSPQYSC